jgi:VanZ family protein
MSTTTARVALAFYLLAIYATLGYVRVITNALRDRGALRGSVLTAFALASTVVVILLFRDARNRTFRGAVILMLIGFAYAVVILPMNSPEEKIHFIEYGVVALLAHAASPRTWSSGKRFVRCALFVAAAGWIDELIQALLPTRFYDLRDVAFNAAAGLIALTALAIFSARGRRVDADRPEEVARDAIH